MHDISCNLSNYNLFSISLILIHDKIMHINHIYSPASHSFLYLV
jgi:hypothetical protein